MKTDSAVFTKSGDGVDKFSIPQHISIIQITMKHNDGVNDATFQAYLENEDGALPLHPPITAIAGSPVETCFLTEETLCLFPLEVSSPATLYMQTSGIDADKTRTIKIIYNIIEG